MDYRKCIEVYVIFAVICTVGCVNDQNHDTHESVVNGTPLFEAIPVEYSGVSFKNPVIQTSENNHMINVEFISGAGVAVGDINNDALPDLFFTANQRRDRLYLNKGDLKFQDISDEAGISQDNKWSAGVTYIDIDKDGDQDIYVCRNVYLEDEKSGNQLYINNGDNTFTEQGDQFGLADRGFSIQAIFFDFNKDQLIDMYLVNQPPSIPGQGGQLNMSMASNRLFSDKLYQNRGGNRFEDVTDQANLRNFAFGLSVSVGDFNNDNWPDLYVTNDFDVPDHLYINQHDGTFKNTIWESMKHISNFSMGSDVADYDNDGNLDIMVLDMMAEDHKRIKTHMGAMKPEIFWQLVESGGHYQYMFNSLQRNNGNGTFSDLAHLAGVTNTDWSWAPLLADFNNDGHKDLFVSNGVKSNNRLSDLTNVYQKRLDSITAIAQQRGVNPQDLVDVVAFAKMAPTDKLNNYIFKNNGDYTFSKKIDEWGLTEHTLSNGAAYADLDADGDLDLIINNIDDHALLYKNNTVENNLGNFIRFKLIPADKLLLYGTRVTLYENDKLWQLIEIANARGYMSKSENIAHFGTGNSDLIEKVVIDWMDGTQTILKSVPANKVHEIRQSDYPTDLVAKDDKSVNPLFVPVEDLLNLSSVYHLENEFDDYAREILLPHKMSQFGPSLAVGDVNGDGLEDFFMGGAAGFFGTLFVQQKSGKFAAVQNGAWSVDKACEDMGVALVDINGDNSLDLFVVSGGNEFEPESPELQDRVYINNGRGVFSKDDSAVPKYLASGSCVRPFDYDGDGDQDLFIGGRLVPGKYPHPANSYLLENQSGKLINVTAEKAKEFEALGMVTDASWMDYNNDQSMDLVVVGEWMPITIFTQSVNGEFEKHIQPGLENSEGWYYSVTSDDLDLDGDIDIVAGNLGRNYKYKASIEEPFEVYSHDFDENGSLDIVLSYYEHGELFPVRGKDCSTQQIPSFGKKFKTYAEFASSDLHDVYGQSLEEAYHLQARTFASLYIENLGDGKFIQKTLPPLAQVSSINAILINDYNQDGHKDIITCGNLHPAEIETPRNDAGIGLVLLGDGKGQFTPMPVNASGFFTPNDAKDMQVIHAGNREILLIANNNNRLQALEFSKKVL